MTPDLNALTEAAVRVDPEASFVEMGEGVFMYILAHDRLNRLEGGIREETPKRFCYVPIKIRKYLVGWRILTSEFLIGVPDFPATDYCIQRRGQPDLHVAAISPDFDEHEASSYEALTGV